jgi:hypothetical protein
MTHTLIYITRYSKHYKNHTLDSSTHTPFILYKTQPAPQNTHTATHNTTERNAHHHKVSTHSTTLKETPMYSIHEMLTQFMSTGCRHTATYAAHWRNYALDFNILTRSMTACRVAAVSTTIWERLGMAEWVETCSAMDVWNKFKILKTLILRF